MAAEDSFGTYLSVAAEVVQASTAIGIGEFGDGYGAVQALEARCHSMSSLKFKSYMRILQV